MSAYRKHPGKAILAGLGNGILLVGLPYAAISFILSFLQSQPPQISSILAGFITSLEEIRRNLLIFGGGATVFAALRALYPKGALPRAGFVMGRQGFRYAYLAVVLNGGLWVLALPLGFGLGSGSYVQGALDLTRLFTLLYIAIAVTAAHGVMEYLVHRKALSIPQGYFPSGTLGSTYGVPPPPEEDVLGPMPPFGR